MNTPADMYFVRYVEQDLLVAAFASGDDAIDFVVAHEETYGFAPNSDMEIVNAARIRILTVLGYTFHRPIECH